MCCMPFIVYLLTCKASGKSYVGQTRRGLEARWWQHCNDALSRGYSHLMCRAIRKHGADDWTREILHTAKDLREARDLEIQEIAEHGTLVPGGYNMTVGGEMVSPHTKSPEVVARIAASNRGQKRSPETCARISEKRKARPLHPNQIAALKRNAALKRGRPNSAESIEKQRQAIMGHAVSQETRDKIAAKARGRRHSNEVLERIREKITGPNSKIARTIIVLFPDGRRETITGLSHFCRKHDLIPGSVRHALRKNLVHKGFQFSEPT